MQRRTKPMKNREKDEEESKTYRKLECGKRERERERREDEDEEALEGTTSMLSQDFYVFSLHLVSL